LTERGTEILNHWAATDERHTHAISEVEARLSEWGAIESRLHQESLQRIRSLETTIEQEWKTLRQMHEEPLQQLRDQAAALGETCVAAANLSLRGYERAEARLAALETDLRGQLSQLSRDVHAALEAIKHDASRPAALPAAAPFPLDSVMRIHEELRENGKAGTDLVPVGPASGTAAALPDPSRQLAASSDALSNRMESLEREVTSGMIEARETAARTDRLQRDWRVTLGLVGVAVVIVAGLGLRLQRHVTTSLNEASTRVTAAETASAAASREIASARAEAERQSVAARQAAARAQLVTDILAAPDLVRFNLTGAATAQGAAGHVMWSRTRGLIVSALGLQPAAAGSSYQTWLLNNITYARAGVLQPDGSGRATLVTENPPNLPRPVNGAAVTLEPTGGSGPQPAGSAVLVRAVPVVQ